MGRFEVREEGREIGRRLGVRKRKGTPATSSLCLCIRSRTCCSSYGRSIKAWNRAFLHSQTRCRWMGKFQ